MTKFFEPINVSATHIYHSALELTPLSSIVRTLYHCYRFASFPRVEVGIPDSQDLSVSIPIHYHRREVVTWSPCGQFIAAWGEKGIEIRNGLTLELVSTLQSVIGYLDTLPPTYAPSGHFIAGITLAGITVWDIQTGGVVKNIQCNPEGSRVLKWSLDGQEVSVLTLKQVHVYDITSKGRSTVVNFEPSYCEHLWSHNKSFQIMRCSCLGGGNFIIDIFEVAPILIKIDSFSILANKGCYYINSFSPTTYHISGQTGGTPKKLLIMDIQNSEMLLVEKGEFWGDSFSSNGSCFGAFHSDYIHLWEYEDGHYIRWRQVLSPGGHISIIFSPTSSSIVVDHLASLWLTHLNHSPTAPPTHTPQLEIFSHSGTSIATLRYKGKTITITNCSSEPSSQSIDTGIKITGFGLTGNVLLAKGVGVVKAWLLTGEGWVSNVLENRGTTQSDNIWSVPLPHRYKAKFSIEGDTGAIGDGKENPLFVYNARTGELLESTQELSHFHGSWYSFTDNLQARDYHNDSSQQSIPAQVREKPDLRGRWIKSHEGKHLLWLPAEWRVARAQVQWSPDTATIKFKSRIGKPIVIKLQ